MQDFVTTNPDHLLYSRGALEIALLGGINPGTLDRMRVTLKISHSNQTIRHSLDLYNDTQTERLIRKAAARLQLPLLEVQDAISNLTDELEAYRLELITEKQAEPEQTDRLSPAQRRAAEDYLSGPDLLRRTQEDIEKSGIVGEERARLLMYLVFTSRKMANPLHVISLGESGSGKSHLQSAVGELIPTSEKLEVTVLSENAFYYFDQYELQHKLILIEDLDGAESALYPIRELQSKKRITKTVSQKDKSGRTRTVQRKVEGPVCVAGCTTRERVYEDNANRSFLIRIDQSGEQDERIMQYQRAFSAGKINLEQQEEAKKRLRNVQSLLGPVRVVNPYAEILKIPAECFKPRRTHAHYLGFIEAVTLYHQFQRPQKVDKKTGEITVETAAEDIAVANVLLRDALLRKSDELSGACRSFFERLKSWLKDRRAENESDSYHNQEARHALRVSPATFGRHHRSLIATGLVGITGGSRARGFAYQVLVWDEYEELEKGIDRVLEATMDQIGAEKGLMQKIREALSIPAVAQSPNEPLKRLKTRG